jgi:hypothetical protein
MAKAVHMANTPKIIETGYAVPMAVKGLNIIENLAFFIIRSVLDSIICSEKLQSMAPMKKEIKTKLFSIKTILNSVSNL